MTVEARVRNLLLSHGDGSTVKKEEIDAVVDLLQLHDRRSSGRCYAGRLTANCILQCL